LFGSDSMIILQPSLFEFTFEFVRILFIKYNDLRLWVTFQPVFMKKNMDGCCQLRLWIKSKSKTSSKVSWGSLVLSSVVEDLI
jgi:hypothetical protein